MDDRDRRTINAMLRYGGGFVEALARAAEKADAQNLEIIKRSWSGYWALYDAMAEGHDLAGVKL